VITKLSFRTVAAPDATNFHLTWPFPAAAALIEAWQSWAPHGPDELAASLLIHAGAEIDGPPSVELFGVMLGARSETERQVEAMVSRARSDPSSSFSRHMSFGETIRFWADKASRDPVEGEPPGQELRGHRFIKSEFFRRPLPPEAMQRLLDNLVRDRVSGQSRELDFSPWGGGYGRLRADRTAFVHRDELFWLKHATEVAPLAPAAEKERAHDWVTRSWETVHQHGTGGVFSNFPDPDLEDWLHAYYGSNAERLLEVKARYDPENLFRFSQSLPVR
jgi:Berberine and berberine like